MNPPPTESVTVLLFASYAELLGAPSVSLRLEPGATVGDLIASVRTLPGGERLPERPLCARNLAVARLDEEVAPGDELALLPPMAGG